MKKQKFYKDFLLPARIIGDEEACSDILHEATHLFGLEDGYKQDGHDVNNEYVCIMEAFEKSPSLKYHEDLYYGFISPFCSSCESSAHNLFLTRIIEGN